MALQNRVDPFGELIATSARGRLMGNRGGRIHTDDQRLTRRRWVTKQWIACVLEFNGRRRDVWGRYYTELFFLDEVTALSAGHRPCFECRRKDAEAFADCWRRACKMRTRPRAAEMDEILHRERLDGRTKRRRHMRLDILPDGAMVAIDDEAFAVRGSTLLHWTPEGYDSRRTRPGDIVADVLTPPSIVAVLHAGYAPRWHPSAATFLHPAQAARPR